MRKLEPLVSTHVVSVVAGGWSVSQVQHQIIPGYTIAVNDSALYLASKPNEIVSMDRAWSEARIQFLIDTQVNTYLRRSAVQNLHASIHGRPWFHVFDCNNESWVMADDYFYLTKTDQKVLMTDKPYVLNGTNSGMCAINRAYKLQPRELYLFGFDMQFGPNGEKHWYPDYTWEYASTTKRLNNWARQFETIAKQFAKIGTKVYNVNNRSRIKAFGPQVWLPELEALKVAA